MAESVNTLPPSICEDGVQASLFPPKPAKPFNGIMQSYHYAWLAAHPDRTRQWLKSRLIDGFHVHHVDGDHSNDEPLNLVLIEGTDHLRLHGMQLRNGIKRWRVGIGRKAQRRISSKREARSRIAEADLAALASRVATKHRPLHHTQDLDPLAMVAAHKALLSGSAPREAQQAVVDTCQHLSWASARRIVKHAMSIYK